MLLPLALIACQNAQTSQVVPLQGTQPDDDLPGRVYFTPDNTRLIVHHGLESGTTSLTEVDLGLGQAVSRSAEYQECHSIAVSPDGLIALVPEEYSGRLRVLSVPGLQLSASVTLSNSSGNDHFIAAVDSTSTRAVLRIDYEARFWIIDLATGAQERFINLPPNLRPTEVLIGADDVSMPLFESQSVFTLDISTGLESARTPVGVPGNITTAGMSGDGTLVVVLTTDPASGSRYLERFGLPGLASLGTVALSGAYPTNPGFGRAELDHSGSRLLMHTSTGSTVVDVATGALTAMPNGTGGGHLNSTGTRVVAYNGVGIIVADATTGATLGRIEPRGRERGQPWLELSPNGRFAAFTRRGSERVEVYDIAGPSPIPWADVSSGFADEADGPFSFVLSADGDKAAVIGRDSDDLRVVGLGGAPAVLGRVALDRAPECIALRADGKAVVVHGRGESVSIVDLDGLAELARFALPDAGYVVQPEPQGAAAWVLVDGATSRALLRFDTASGATLATVALPGGSGATALGHEVLATIHFDLPRGRAFVASPDTGELALIDLNAAVVVQTVPVPTSMDSATLALSADGAALFHRGSLLDVSAFDVSAQGLSPSWSWSCGPPISTSERKSLMTLFDSDRYLLAMSGCATSWTVLDASTGAASVSISYSADALSLDSFDDEVWANFSQGGILRLRASGPNLVFTGSEGHWECCESLIHFAPIGRTVGLAEDRADEGYAFNDRLFVLDLVQDTLACTPNVPNSTGAVASLRADGRGFAGAPLIVTAEGLQPGSMFGYLLAGSAGTAPTPLAPGVGELCVGGTVAHFRDQVQLADAAGRQRFVVDTRGIPIPAGPTAVQPGTSWVFQVWHRDVTPSGAASSNTTTARTVRFD